MSDFAEPSIPSEILGRPVTEICPECKGEGRLWECDNAFTTHWAVRCEVCNCVGYLLDVPLDQQKPDQLDVPF